MSTTAEPVYDPVHGARHAFTADGDNLIVDTWLEPGGALPPHLHPRQDEFWSVVEGEVEILVGKRKRVMRATDGEAAVPPGTKHGLRNRSRETVHARCRVIPAGDLEEFLTESAAAAREGLFMRGGIPRGLRGARWGARFLKRHRDETVMTFPPRFLQAALIALFARSDD
jgi:mannose-6-phosphate isomerase-like protein (cupin superfamily)